MSEKSAIEWTDATWNPWHGCHKISPGCKNCYMFREKKMYGQDPNVVLRSKTKFSDPLKWKEPKLVFTCSWSDWFIEEADAWRDEAWDIIRRTPQHTYQILTKRIERAAGCMPSPPLPNVWLGVSIEDRPHKYRMQELAETPAAVRFLSLEPLLEDLGELDLTGADWVIVGGESGPGARPMHPDFARSIRDQCVAAGVPFFFKQWGEYLPDSQNRDMTEAGRSLAKDWQGIRVGKKAAGRLLDGREWNEMPAAASAASTPVHRPNPMGYSYLWRTRRPFDLARASYACARCSVEDQPFGTYSNLERAHLDGDPRNDAPDNALVMCRRCHRALDHPQWLIAYRAWLEREREKRIDARDRERPILQLLSEGAEA